MALKLGILILIISFNNAIAISTDTARKYCRQFSTEFSRHSFINSFVDKKNRLAFTNKGGLFGIGVCWWHSRFQRAASYLAYYDPQKPRPNNQAVDKIITAIIDQSGVVEVPGFSNLEEFSRTHEANIQSALEKWQIIDSLSGALNRSVNPFRPSFNSYNEELIHTFYRLHNLINHEQVIPFVIEQNKGFDAHAYLVIKSEMLGASIWDQKIKLTVIDSNSLQLNTVTLDRESHDRIYFDKQKIKGFAVYIDYARDLSRIEKKIKEFCPSYTVKVAPNVSFKYEY